jgi:hypothetical protein
MVTLLHSAHIHSRIIDSLSDKINQYQKSGASSYMHLPTFKRIRRIRTHRGAADDMPWVTAP